MNIENMTDAEFERFASTRSLEKAQKEIAKEQDLKTYNVLISKAKGGDKGAEAAVKQIEKSAASDAAKEGGVHLDSSRTLRESVSSTVVLEAYNETVLADKIFKRKGAPLSNLVHSYVIRNEADLDDNTMDGAEYSYKDVEGGITGERKVTETCKVLARKYQVSLVQESHDSADNVSEFKIQRLSNAHNLMKQLNRTFYDGDPSVDVKDIRGLDAIQREYGARNLRFQAGGGKLTTGLIDTVSTAVMNAGGGRVTDLFCSATDNANLSTEIARRNTSDGKGQAAEYTKYLDLITGQRVNINIEAQNTSTLKKVASATHDDGAIQFTGAVSDGDTITIKGLVYTAAAEENIAERKFLEGTAAISAASFLTVLNSYQENEGSVIGIEDYTDSTKINLQAIEAGKLGNEIKIEKTGTGVTVNVAQLSDGANNKVYLVNMNNIQLREFKLAGISGFQDRLTDLNEYNFIRRDVSWIGLVEYNSPNGIAVIENVG